MDYFSQSPGTMGNDFRYLQYAEQFQNFGVSKDFTGKSKLQVFVDQMEYGQAERSIDYGAMQITRHIGEAIEGLRLEQGSKTH